MSSRTVVPAPKPRAPKRPERPFLLRDDDPERAARTAALVDELIAHAGLDSSRVRIFVNREAEHRANARGADGLLTDRAIYLHPDRFDPRSSAGRYLLAHEAAHLSQSLLTEPQAPRADAEAEADLAGNAFAAHQPTSPIAHALPSLATAANTDADQLRDLVKQTRKREIQLIRDLLHKLIITDANVEEILRVLERASFPVASAMVSALEPGERKDFINNIDTPHLKPHRREILAACQALDPAAIHSKDVDLGFFEHLVLEELAPEELAAARYALQQLPAADLQNLLESSNKAGIKAVMKSDLPEDFDPLAEARKALEAERAESAQRQATQGKLDKTALADYFKQILADKKEPARMLDKIAAKKDDPEQVRFLVEALDAAGELEPFIKKLPASERLSPAHIEAFDLVLHFRPPERNIEQAQSLLSYGLFDWAITDDEARFAYHLVKQSPLADQDRFRRRDNGKWYQRLERNISKEVKDSGEYTGIEVRRDEQGQLTDVTAKYQQVLASGPGQADWETIRKLCENGIDKKTAPDLFAALERVGSDLILEAITRRMDREGWVSDLFGALPTEFLLAEEHRHTTLRIMVSRDPVYLEIHARDLLRQGFFAVVTARDAWLAYQLVKALPEADLKAFIRDDNGELWNRIFAEMTPEMRKSEDLNLYRGGKKAFDIAAIEGRLLDPATWTPEHAAELSAFIRMAIAAGDHRWVFEQSKVHQIFRVDALQKIVERYALYDEKRRPVYKPNDLKGTGFFEEGIFQSLAAAGRWIGFALGHWSLLLAQKSVGVQDLNLGDVQKAMGGDIAGVELDTKSEARGAEAPNTLNIRWDLGQGVVDAALPEIRIASINLPFGDLKVQAGTGVLTGLKVHAAYPQGDLERPESAYLHLARFALEDILLVWPDSMVAVNHVGLTALQAGAGNTEVPPEDATQAREGHYVPIPIFWPLIGAVINAVRAVGGVKKLKQMTSMAAFDVSFQSFEVEGLSTSGGQNVASAKINDFHLRVGGTTSAYLHALIHSLEERIAIADGPAKQGLEADLAKAKDELAGLAKKHARMVELQHKYLADPGSFDEKDEAELHELQEGLQGGAILDIGGISATGITGTVTAGDISLTKLHGEGRSADLAMPVITDPELVARFQKGPAGAEKKEPAKEGFTLTLGNLETHDLKVQQAIPDPKDLDKQIDKLLESLRTNPDPQIGQKIDKLRRRRDLALEYEAFASKGVTFLSPEEARQFLAVRQQLLTTYALEVDELSLKGTKLTVGAAGASVGVQIDDLSAKGIRMDGLRIGQVSGKSVTVDATLQDGWKSILDPRKNLRKAGIGGDLEFQHIAQEDSGAEIDRLALTGLHADLDRNGKDATAHLVANSIVAEGVSVTVSEDLLRQELNFLREQNAAQPSEANDKKIAAIESSLADLRSYRDLLAESKAKLAAAKPGSKAAEEAQQQVDFTEASMQAWSRQLAAKGISIDKLNVTVSGLGDVLGEDYDIGKQNITVEGGGPQHQIAAGATLRGVKGAGVEGDLIELGPVGGKITWSEKHIGLEDVYFDSIALEGVAYHGAPNHLGSQGRTILSGVRITGDINSEERQDKYGHKSIQLANVQVRQFRIDKISADQLTYHKNDPDGDLDITVESGEVGDILLSGFDLRFPQGGDMEIAAGEAGIGSLRDLKLRGFLGSGIQGRGTLNGSGLSVKYLSDKKQSFQIDDLVLTGADAQVHSSHIRIARTSLKNFSGTLITTDAGYELQKLHLDDFQIGKASYSGGDTNLEILDHALFHGIDVNARIVMAKDKEGKKHVDDIVITHMGVEQIDAVGIKARIGDEKDGKTIELPKGTIKGLTVDGFEKKALKGSIDIKSAEIEKLKYVATAKGKQEMAATVSLKATDMGGTLYGPDYQIFNLGTIQSVSGEFEGKGAKVEAFTAENIQGTITRGKDYDQLGGLTLGKLHLDHSTFETDEGAKMGLQSADANGIRLVNLKANYSLNSKGEKDTIQSVSLEGFEIDHVEAAALEYNGPKDASLGGPGLALEAKNASIDRLNLKQLNWTKDKLTFAGAVDAANISGLVATLRKSTGLTRLTTDVKAEGMSADLALETVKDSTGTWTRPTGKFKLDKFGLFSPKVEITDAAGNTTTIGNIPEQTGGRAAVGVAGAELEFDKEGAPTLTAKRVIAENLGVAAGTTKVVVPYAEITNLAAGLPNLHEQDALDRLAVTAEKLSVQGVKVVMQIDKSKADPKGTPGLDLNLEPLAGMNGNVQVRFLAAGLTFTGAVPIVNGRVEMNDVDASVATAGIDSKGMYAQTVGRYHFMPPGPGLYPGFDEDATYPTDYNNRGHIFVREFVEGILAKPSDGQTPEEKEWLKSLGIWSRGKVGLGQGKLGKGENYINLEGDNKISIGPSLAGSALRVDSDKLHAGSAHFEGAGQEGRTGVIDVVNLTVLVGGLATLKWTITINLDSGTVANIEYGDPVILKRIKGTKK